MIEFIEESHTYLYDGWKVLPSVTQILSKIFKDKYKDVPENILNEKAKYGTHVHKLIEVLGKKKPKKPVGYLKKYYGMNIYQEYSIKDYLEIVDKYNIEIIENEKIVHYKDKYAGTLDIKARVNGKLVLIDIKTTYELDEEYVAWQNSYYELADESADELYVLWLPKGHKGKLVRLERIEETRLLEELEEI